MQEHYVKAWPEYFAPLWDGQKTAEIRVNDRGYQVGDTLVNQEWEPMTQVYTGREIAHTITHMVEGAPFLPAGVAMLSLFRNPLWRRDGEDLVELQM